MKLNFRRLLAMFLSIVMVAGMLPAAVFAEDAVVETQSETYVAQVGETQYTDLQSAVKAAQAGNQIILLRDTDEDVTVPAGVIFNGKGKQVGAITAAGEITFEGCTKATNFSVLNTNTTINIGEGACLEITGTSRMVIGHGCTFNITGTIPDAKTANTAELTPSLIMPGASFTGAGVTFNVTNAYITAPSSYCSSNKNASGTFDFNITNSIIETADKLAFEAQSTAATVNFKLKNSVLTTGSHLVFGVSSGEIVIDNSNVNVGTPRQIENRSTMTIKNGSVVNGAVATSSNAINPGTIIVEDATYAVTGQFSGAAEGTGTLIIKKGANVSVGSIVDNANIQIDATGMAAGDEINFTANLSKFEGSPEVINNSALEAKIVDGKIVLSAKPVAQIGETYFASLNEAIAAVKESGDTLKLLADATESMTISDKDNEIANKPPIIIDLNGFTVTSAESTLWVSDGYVVTVMDSSEAKTGKIVTTSTGDEAIAIARGGKVILNSGTVEGEGYGIYLYSDRATGGEALEMNGGTVTVPNGGTAIAIGSGKVTINAGKVLCNKVPNGTGWNTYVYQGGTLKITGGTFLGTIGNFGTTSISGGTFSYCEDPNDGFNNSHLASGCTTKKNDNGSITIVPIQLTTDDNGYSVVSTYEELLKALETENAKVILANDITATATQSTRYGKTGIILDAGDILDGNYHKLTINGANTTWDSAITMRGGEVKNLTIAGAMRGVFMPGANGDVVIDNCKFDTIYTFNSDAGSKDYTVTIKDTTLNGWTSFSDVHKSVTFENCSFGKGSDYAFCRPHQATTFTNCSFDEGFKLDTAIVDDDALVFTGCTYAGAELSADNNAMFSGGGSVVINGVPTDVTPPTGSNSYAYTKEVDGYVRVWGEGGGNAKKSFVLKLYSGDTLIATTKLNNVGGIIDGDVHVTWNFYYPKSTDDYWTTTWEEGHPNSAAKPTKVELIIDGTVVAITDAKMSGADDVNPVVWEELGGVAHKAIEVTYDDGTVEYFDDILKAVEEKTNNDRLEGATIKLLGDYTGSGIRFYEHNMILDLNGHTYTINRGTGSDKTKNQCFQVRSEAANIVIKNGSIRIAEKAKRVENVDIYWVFNGYCDYTLEDVTVDCTNLDAATTNYVVLTRGAAQLTGATSIVNFNGNGPSVAVSEGSVVIDTTGAIAGGIESDGYVELKNGTVTGALVLSNAAATLMGPEGLNVTTTVDGYEVKYAEGKYTVVEKVGTIKATEATLLYNEIIQMRFIFALTGDAESNGILVFKDKSDADNHEISKAAQNRSLEFKSGKYYGYTDGIPAKEMGDTVYIVGYLKFADGTYAFSQTVPYSPLIYAERMMTKGTEETKALCKALMHYGAAAQTFMNYNTSNLMNANFEEVPFDISVLGNEQFSYQSGNVNGFTIKEANMLFEGAISYRFKYQIDSSLEGKALYMEYVVKGVTKTVELKAIGDFYYGYAADNAAKDMDELIIAKPFYYNENNEKVYGGSITYSGYEYARRMTNSSTATAAGKALAQAFAMYINAANTAIK